MTLYRRSAHLLRPVFACFASSFSLAHEGAVALAIVQVLSKQSAPGWDLLGLNHGRVLGALGASEAPAEGHATSVIRAHLRPIMRSRGFLSSFYGHKNSSQRS